MAHHVFDSYSEMVAWPAKHGDTAEIRRGKGKVVATGRIINGKFVCDDNQTMSTKDEK